MSATAAGTRLRITSATNPERKIPHQVDPPAAADDLEHRARDREAAARVPRAGQRHLKPMTMVQIADVVGVHETTVSRAISGKYMSTPQGVFEMKYFFTPGYQTSSGEAMSNTSVKEAIEDLVKNEDGSAPLSDKEIVEILGDRGIPIARRTVAKYRTELNILPSNMRRKY
jgi:RNA polymerase sigma-54 factor